MQRYVILLNFTDSGLREIDQSPARARNFRDMAEAAGAKVESIFWTQGQYDGVLQFTAPDEQTAAGLVLSLHKADKVRTRTLRAFDSDEFQEILNKIPG